MAAAIVTRLTNIAVGESIIAAEFTGAARS
jgi:hypothetical protein